MPMEKRYPACRCMPLKAAGLTLTALGVIILFVCIPRWAWWALTGLVLIALGFVLLRLSNAWR